MYVSVLKGVSIAFLNLENQYVIELETWTNDWKILVIQNPFELFPGPGIW